MDCLCSSLQKEKKKINFYYGSNFGSAMKMHFTIFCSVLEPNALSSAGCSNKDLVGKVGLLGGFNCSGVLPPPWVSHHLCGCWGPKDSEGKIWNTHCTLWEVINLWQKMGEIVPKEGYTWIPWITLFIPFPPSSLPVMNILYKIYQEQAVHMTSNQEIRKCLCYFWVTNPQWFLFGSNFACKAK